MKNLLNNKKLLIEGSLVVILFVMIMLSLTLAWFGSSRQTNVDDFTINVSSSDTFEISLDGVNYSRKLNIDLFSDGDTSSIQMADLTGVLSSVISDNSKTYQSLSIRNPLRNDDDGSPKLDLGAGNVWPNAIGTKVTQSGSKYYLQSTNESNAAEYVEFDLWIRSDAALDIYLGKDSIIAPYEETSDDYLSAMFSTLEYQAGYKTYKYKDQSAPYLTIVSDINGDNYTYYFKDAYESDTSTNIKHTFIIKSISKTVTENSVEQSYIYYYDEHNNFVARSQKMGDYTYYYDDSSAKNFICKTKFSDTGKRLNEYYEQNSSTTIAAPTNLNKYLKAYLDIFKLEGWTPEVNTFDKYSKECFYDKDGKLLICKVTDKNNVVTYYDQDINMKTTITATPVSAPSKPYKVITESVYGEESLTYIDTTKVFLDSSYTYSFSKNLACGAALMSFSEVVTDQFSENETTVTKEVEDLRYIWNPLPQYGFKNLSTDSIYNYFYVDNNRNETISYYTEDSENGKYTLDSATWTKSNALIRTGAIKTYENYIDSGETPLVSTEANVGETFSVKKLRIKLWIDGNDELSVNSMLNSSKQGNGKFNISLNLVANTNNTIVELDDTRTSDYDSNIYYLTARKSNGEDGAYDWSVIGEWTNQSGEAFGTASIDQTGKLTFRKYGTVTVVAKEKNDARIGTYVITHDYARLKSEKTDNEDNNEYLVQAIKPNYTDDEISAWTEEIKSYLRMDGKTYDYTWSVSDTSVATVSTNEDGQAVVTFKKAGSIILSFKTIQTFYTDKGTPIEYVLTYSIAMQHSGE